jgi:3-hexulose-6-phosphate synthase/6-phospho-3-hexuloisomerase
MARGSTVATLQVALDFIDLSRAMRVAEAAAAAGATWLEAGTPLIKAEGMHAVRELRKRFPKATIIADMKTLDAGRIEVEMAAKAGANVVLVMAVAGEPTLRECVEAGAHYGCRIGVDLHGVDDPAAAAERMAALGAGHVEVHTPIDAQMHGAAPFDLLRRIAGRVGVPVAAAGGLTGETVVAAAQAGAEIIVVGGAICKAADPKAATAAILAAIASGAPAKAEGLKRSGAEAEALRAILTAVSTANISNGSHYTPSLRGIRPIAPGMKLAGPVVTVRTLPGDWAKPVEAIDVAKPGDVIVIDAAGRPPAIWGELASRSALGRRLAGVVIDGAIRDTADIRGLGFPAFARHVCSDAGHPKGLGEINAPITIAGVSVAPGDWIAGDDDGVIVLPKAKIVEMANRAADNLEAENRLRKEITDGGTLASVIDLSKWEKAIG